MLRSWLALQVSLSQLYTRALAEYLKVRHETVITAQLNAIYPDLASSIDPDFAAAQFEVLSHEAW